MKNILIIVIALGLILFSTFIVSTLTNDSIISGDRVDMNMKFALPVKLELKEDVLLFFGYVGCDDVCSPRMNEIASIYKKYERAAKNNLDVLFISLKSTENPEVVDMFAKNFNESFIGLTLQREDLLELTSSFNAHFSKSLIDHEKINHTQYLYYIKKNKDGILYLKNIYLQTPYNQKVIVSDLLRKNNG